jgi:moderate conductance mechanosensitive channel
MPAPFREPFSLERLLLILGVAIAAHIAVMLVRAATRWLVGSRLGSITKARTFTGFLASVAAFAIWFIAIGFVLYELGVPLQTYIASATIIGLAVSFGSQSLVQDVISGLTLIFTGLIDAGDMVDIGGQVGIVEKIGIRYTELRNVQGALVYIPNRNVGNVTTYPVGSVRAFVDVRLPAAEPQHALEQLRWIADAVYRQFSGIMTVAPTIRHMNEAMEAGEMQEKGSAVERPESGTFVRLRFRIWPGQGALIENTVRQRIIQSMRAMDPTYQDWMVAVHYRVEPAFQRRAFSALEAIRQRRPRRP